MHCDRELLRNVPLFALLDDDEAAVLASQVEVKQFAARERIYKIGDEGGRGYILVSGKVRVATVDQDNQEVVIDEPAQGEFFGFASMLDGTQHKSYAIALEQSVCIEVDRKDITVLLVQKPHAGMDMLTVLGKQFHSSQELIRVRAARNPNEIIEEKTTIGDHIADAVARFGGSWKFIITFGVVLVVCLGSLSVHSPKPVSLDARGNPGSGHHDEPEPPGFKRSCAQRTRFSSESQVRVSNSGIGPKTESNLR
jgi:CRP/FNR family transcriptional regulator, cyclic AMP receptor protein